MKPDIQGVILIDTWADPELRDFYIGVADRTSEFNIRCCVNASYGLDLANLVPGNTPGQDTSMRNTFRLHQYNRLYDDHSKSPDDSRRRDNQLIMNVIRHSHSHFRTDPILTTPNLLHSDASVMAMEIEDFLHHVDSYHNNSIKDWLVVGQSWLSCVHFRPMGVVALADLVDSHGFNFYVTPWSVVDKNKKSISKKSFTDLDPIVWQSIPKFGYKIVGKR